MISLGHQYPVCFPEIPHPGGIELAPLDLAICTSPGCSLMQLTSTIPPEKLFREQYWYRSGVNPSMVAALKDLVTSACQRRPLWDGAWVVDIGANDGTLLKQYQEVTRYEVLTCGFEPAKNLFPQVQAVADLAVNDFFPGAGPGVSPRGSKLQAAIITAVAMAYDLPDPNEFFAGVAELLIDDGLFVVQVGYLGDMIRQNSFDQICHEHVEYYSLTSLSYVLAKQGLVVEDVEWNSTNGGSIRCYCRHAESGAAPSAKVLSRLHEEEVCGMHSPLPYQQLMRRIDQARAQVRDILEAEKGEATVYGASTKGLTTMQYFGLDSRLVHKAAERSEEKWGRWYGNTGVEIIGEEAWRSLPPRLAFCPIWHFAEGILEREKEWLARGGRFLFPLPAVRVLGGK